MTTMMRQLLGARLEEIAQGAAGAIVQVIGREQNQEVLALQGFRAGKAASPTEELQELLMAAQRVHGPRDPELDQRLLRFIRVVGRTPR